MHEPDDHKRWLDLLDDLGLPPESQTGTPAPVVKAAPAPAAPVAGVAAPAAPAEVEPVAEEAPAPRTRRKKAAAVAPEGEPEKEPAPRTRRKRRVAKTEEAAEEAPAPAEEAPAPAKAPTHVHVHVHAESVTIETPEDAPEHPAVEQPMLEAIETGGDESLDIEGEVEPAPNGEDPAKTLRRRRRRRRRKASDAAEGSAVQPAVAGRAMVEEALEDAEDDESETRLLATELISDEEDEEPSEPAPIREEDIEFEDLTNLDMPSWSELVGSLYRPPDR